MTREGGLTCYDMCGKKRLTIHTRYNIRQGYDLSIQPILLCTYAFAVSSPNDWLIRDSYCDKDQLQEMQFFPLDVSNLVGLQATNEAREHSKARRIIITKPSFIKL